MLRKMHLVIGVMVIMALLLSACTVAAPAPAAEPGGGAAATEAPAAEAPAASGDVVERRATWHNDGNEGEVMRDLLDRFEADNPDIKVVMDTVDYASGIQQTLPI